jgi:ABC-2 type transport system permease protein
LRFTRVWRIAQEVVTGFHRDPRVLWALLLVPVGTFLLMGYLMRNTQDEVKVALVVTGEHWAALDSASYVEESLASDDIVTFRTPSREAAQQAVRDGRAQGFVVIDDAFARGVLGGEQQTVAVGIKGDNPTANRTVLTALGHALSVAPLKAFRKATGAEPSAPGGPLTFDTTYVYGGEEYQALDHVVPALLASLIFICILTVAVIDFTVERTFHTLERMMATPLRRMELILGWMLGYAAVAIVQAGFILSVVVLVLRVHHAGNLGVIFLLSVITALGALNLGVFLSSLCQSEMQAAQMLPLVLIPQFILCGVIFPLETLPGALRVVARFMPMTYSVSALRDVMIRDRGLLNAGVASDTAVLLAFMAFFLVLGVRTLRREVA